MIDISDLMPNKPKNVYPTIFDKKRNYNRLIIIGNGFDLAHGFNTRFIDFLEHYFNEAISSLYHTLSYNDILFSFHIEGNATPEALGVGEKGETAVKEVKYYLEQPEANNGVKMSFIHIVPLLRRLIYSPIENWVDIEQIYYEVLLEIKNMPDRINDLNIQMEFIRGKLIDYLIAETEEIKEVLNIDKIADCMTEDLLTDDIPIYNLEGNKKPEKILFLNFNYTLTLADYKIACAQKINHVEENFIHGDLKSTHGEPIFGYGDEMDKDYTKIEEAKNNELFKFFKSFWYLQESNYHNLLRFIESDSFQVHIYGHSCGLSDRTMLNTIFENENCISIKVFYHEREDGTDDFTEKSYEIARHFKDKAMLREKLVPKNKSKAMPQPIIK